MPHRRHRTATPSRSVGAWVVISLLLSLGTPAGVTASPVIESPAVIMEAELLTEQAYLLDAAALQDRLSRLQQQWADQPELFEATMVAWIRALAEQPSDPVLNDTLTVLGSYRPQVMTTHPDRQGVLVPRYLIGAEIAATRNAWVRADSEALTRNLIRTAQIGALDRHVDALTHRQAIAGTGQALLQALNQTPSEALRNWLSNAQDNRPIRASLFNIMLDELDSMHWRLILSEQILADGNSVDQALHLRRLDARMGRQQAIAIRQALITDPDTPDALYQLALSAQARATPDDPQLIQTAVAHLQHPSRATASAYSLTQTEAGLTRQMILAQYPQMTEDSRALTRLLMHQRGDQTALTRMDAIDQRERRR